jgi:hypothetical protein
LIKEKELCLGIYPFQMRIGENKFYLAAPQNNSVLLIDRGTSAVTISESVIYPWEVIPDPLTGGGYGVCGGIKKLSQWGELFYFSSSGEIKKIALPWVGIKEGRLKIDPLRQRLFLASFYMGERLEFLPRITVIDMQTYQILTTFYGYFFEIEPLEGKIYIGGRNLKVYSSTFELKSQFNLKDPQLIFDSFHRHLYVFSQRQLVIIDGKTDDIIKWAVLPSLQTEDERFRWWGAPTAIDPHQQLAYTFRQGKESLFVYSFSQNEWKEFPLPGTEKSNLWERVVCANTKGQALLKIKENFYYFDYLTGRFTSFSPFSHGHKLFNSAMVTCDEETGLFYLLSPFSIQPVILEISLSQIVSVPPPLSPHYPNPFNPEVWIPLSQSSGGKVRIYNLLGQVVREIEISQTLASNVIYWDGRSQSGFDLPSGIYFYEITTEEGKTQKIERMIKLR